MKIKVLADFTAPPSGGSYRDEIAFKTGAEAEVPDDFGAVLIANGLAEEAKVGGSKKEKLSGSQSASPEN